MKARYTPETGEPREVDVIAFVAARGGPWSLARLVGKLVARDIITGGDVLDVLELDGSLDLQRDPDPPADEPAPSNDVVAGLDARRDLAQLRAALGVCPDAHHEVALAAAIRAAAASDKRESLVVLPLPDATGIDFGVVESADGGWLMEASCADPDGPLGEKSYVQGERRQTRGRAVVDAWALALSLADSALDDAIATIRGNKHAKAADEKRAKACALELALALGLDTSAGERGWTDLLGEVEALRASQPESVRLIAAERRRQLSAGWDADHDDEHTDGALAIRAAELAIEHTDESLMYVSHERDGWGLVEKHGHDEIRSLTIAGALVAAEIDRILRERGAR